MAKRKARGKVKDVLTALSGPVAKVDARVHKALPAEVSVGDAPEGPKRGKMTRKTRGVPSESQSKTPSERPAYQRGLRRGNPGNRGPASAEDFQAWAAKLLVNPAVQRATRRVLRNPAHPAWGSLRKQLEDRAFGRPKETLEHQGKLTLEALLGGAMGDGPEGDE